MSEMLIDELVVRLGLDTTSLQSEAKQTTQLLDKLRQSAEQTATSTRQASTQATSALARMRGEAVSLLAVLSGGRGLNRLLADLSISSSQTAPRTPRSASTGIPSPSAHATRETRPPRVDQNPAAQRTRFPFSTQERSANTFRTGHAATPRSTPTSTFPATRAGALTGTSHLARFGTSRTDFFSGLAASSSIQSVPLSGSQASAFFARAPGSSHTSLRGHSAAAGARATQPLSWSSHVIPPQAGAFLNTDFPFRNQTGQGRLSHRTLLSATTAAQLTPPATVYTAPTLQHRTVANPLLRPFSRSVTERESIAKAKRVVAFFASETHRTSPRASPSSRFRTQTEHTLATALTRLITHTAHRVARSPTTDPTGQRDGTHAFSSPAGSRVSRTSLKPSRAALTPGYPATRSLISHVSGLSPNRAVTENVPLRSTHTDALTAKPARFPAPLPRCMLTQAGHWRCSPICPALPCCMPQRPRAHRIFRAHPAPQQPPISAPSPSRSHPEIRRPSRRLCKGWGEGTAIPSPASPPSARSENTRLTSE